MIKVSTYFFGAIAFLSIFLASCKKESPYSYTPRAFEPALSDSINKRFGSFVIEDGNYTTIEGIELGRKLFYDTRLSGDNTVACASCHQQQFAFGDQKSFSEGIGGALTGRNSPSIFNLGWNRSFFWDGRRNSLEGQAHDPVTNPSEMNGNWSEIPKLLQNDHTYPVLFYRAFGTGRIDSTLVVKAIAQFERSLLSFNSKYDQFYTSGDSSILSASELRGMEIYLRKGTCNACHTLPLTHLFDQYANIGLEKGPPESGRATVTGLTEDIGKFRTVGLRNLAYTAPYMHNGKFNTIREVLDFYNNNINSTSPNLDPHLRPLVTNRGSLSNQELIDLENFINTLNDPTFITNPAFSNPN